VNTYRYRFACKCPVDSQVIEYDLEIRSAAKILAEDIRRVCRRDMAFHEDIADDLAALGGAQTLRACHQGVNIETVRP
jgi:hypothetical protein